ncbi:MAG TPA: GNAT family N-acetyltransferase [Devosia sp.]|nr:GNAT family N-acetyltransferase [Devosia sp.]
MEIVASDSISAVDETAIRERLRAHNRQVSGFAGPNGELCLAIADDRGDAVGGLTARYAYQWMFVELLFVPPEARGQKLGTRLMEQAEQVARANGLTGIWLDTFAFQARGFYEKLGYSVFGEIADTPQSYSRYFLMKRLQHRET